MQNEKISITKKEFEDMYEITGDTEANTAIIPEPVIPKEQDTTPEFLTEEEQELNDEYLKDYSVPKEEEN